MTNKKLGLGILVMVFALLFAFTACGGAGAGSSEVDDSGRVVITEPGSGSNPLDNKSVEDRWTSSRDDSQDLYDIKYEVGPDGVVKVTVDGPEGYTSWPVGMDISVDYEYTTEANTAYIYTFEAWKEWTSDIRSRNITLQYFNDDHYGPPLNDITLPTITSVRKEYKVYGNMIPYSKVEKLRFKASEVGTYYIKIVSIEKDTSISSITNLTQAQKDSMDIDFRIGIFTAGTSDAYVTSQLSNLGSALVDNLDTIDNLVAVTDDKIRNQVTPIPSIGDDEPYSVAVRFWRGPFAGSVENSLSSGYRWTGSGTYDVWMLTNGNLFKRTGVSFSSGSASIDRSGFVAVP